MNLVEADGAAAMATPMDPVAATNSTMGGTLTTAAANEGDDKNPSEGQSSRTTTTGRTTWK